MKGWGFLMRVIVKAALLFVVVNVAFALLDPVEVIGRVSLYNVILPGRERLPYGVDAAESYNLSINNIPAMFASHMISRPKAADEYRVLVIGDSATWGWLLRKEETYSAYLNAANLKSADGRRIVAYNLGYPLASLTQDLMFLDYAMQYQPDQIVWLVTLAAFTHNVQLDNEPVRNNSPRIHDLIARYHLQLDPNDSRFVNPDFMGKTILGQRRLLADLLRLQLYGFSWAATGIDHTIPTEYTPRRSDFEADESWDIFTTPVTLTTDDLPFDVLNAGIERAGDTPILVVNEPIYISSGTNSSLRYDEYYPRWAFDQYRDLMAGLAGDHGWHYLDLWNRIDPNEFTNTALHLTPAGSRQLSGWLGEAIVDLSSS